MIDLKYKYLENNDNGGYVYNVLYDFLCHNKDFKSYEKVYGNDAPSRLKSFIIGAAVDFLYKYGLNNGIQGSARSINISILKQDRKIWVEVMELCRDQVELEILQYLIGVAHRRDKAKQSIRGQKESSLTVKINNDCLISELTISEFMQLLQTNK